MIQGDGVRLVKGLGWCGMAWHVCWRLRIKSGFKFLYLDSRRVLAPAPKLMWVQPKHTSNPDFGYIVSKD